MEISFDSRTRTIYKELCRQTRRIQESAESVVPDKNDDIGTVASVQTAVFLKSKDITGRGVLVSGEVTASLLYITENENSVSFVNLSKQFTVEFEVDGIDAETLAHVSLSVSNSEARILNPRKVSVVFELISELSCYRQSEIQTDTLIPENAQAALHTKYETAELSFANAVCEKTFTLNEQYTFPGGKPTPSALVSQSADFTVTDSQLIGTKVVLKGNVGVCVCYVSSEVNYPLKAEFSSPFSQIIDIGAGEMKNCTAEIALTSAYYDLTDSINGDKTLDMELHAVIQLITQTSQEMQYVSDVYSNLLPTKCCVHNCQMKMLSETRRLKMSSDERISVAEDCMDVLSVFTTVCQLAQQQGKLSAAVTLDIVYRTKSGGLSAVRRMVNLDSEFDWSTARLTTLRLTDSYLRPDGAYIDGHISVEAVYQSCLCMDLLSVECVQLDEENVYEQSRFPTVTLVRTENESLWELAKAYHSSVDVIAAINDLEDCPCGTLLLIPKTE